MVFDPMAEVEATQQCIRIRAGGVIYCPDDCDAIVASLMVIADRLNVIHEDLERIADMYETEKEGNKR